MARSSDIFGRFAKALDAYVDSKSATTEWPGDYVMTQNNSVQLFFYRVCLNFLNRLADDYHNGRIAENTILWYNARDAAEMLSSRR